VRIVEERQNHAFVRTLREHGSEPSRHFHQHFSALQHTTWESRTGAKLLEWATRELALIDVAVAVAGLNDELCQWIANLPQERLTRAYLTWEPEALTDADVARLQLLDFDVILAPTRPQADVAWLAVQSSIAEADAAAGLSSQRNNAADMLTESIDAAISFERLFLLQALR